MTPTDPMLLVVMLAAGTLFLVVAGVLEWWARRDPRVNDWADRIVEWVLG